MDPKEGQEVDHEQGEDRARAQNRPSRFSRREALQIGAGGLLAAGIVGAPSPRSRGPQTTGGGNVRAARDLLTAATEQDPGVSPSRDLAPAKRASSFLSSLGVNSHIGQGVDSAEPEGKALTYLGISNYRDDADTTYIPDFISIYKQTGARLCVSQSSPTFTEMTEVSAQVADVGGILAVEGPNEPNNFPVTYKGETSGFNTTYLPVAHFQRDLYRWVKANLPGTPVFAVSTPGAEPDNVGLQFLTIPTGAQTLLPAGTHYADYANAHTYDNGNVGQLSWPVDNIAWNAADPTLNGSWDGMYVEYGVTWHEGFAGYPVDQLLNLPRVMTETGWPTPQGGITEAEQAGLFTNIYLSNFARGWAYTYIYMLRDNPSQSGYGLLDVNYNPKPSAVYIHNLTTILADSQTEGGPTSPLAYNIPGQSSTVHDLLLQKSDGQFYLVVWNEQAFGSAYPIVDFGHPTGRVEIYSPSTGTSPVKVLTGTSSVDLTLNGYDAIVLAVG